MIKEDLKNNRDFYYSAYSKLFPRFIDTLTEVSGNFDMLFSNTSQLFRDVLKLSGASSGFAVFLFDNFGSGNQLETSYFESPGVSSEKLKTLLKVTTDLLVNEPSDSPVILTYTDILDSFDEYAVFPDSALAVPVCSGSTVCGYAVVFYFDSSEYCVVDSPQVDFLSKVMRLASIVIKKEYTDAMNISYITNDYLTSLPNRGYIYEMIIYSLQTSEFYETSFALLMIRVNGLKHINNSLGIFTGDAMLKSMGELIKTAATSATAGLNPFVGRLSGADFVVLFTFQDSKKNAGNEKKDYEEVVKICCEALIEKTKDYIAIGEYKIYPSLNIGVSIYPHHGATAEEILKKADLAKAIAKENKPNSYQIYDNYMDGDLERVMFLNNNLPDAISANQFELFYQAQIDTETGIIIGAEALIRWKHPEKGLIFPGYFISYAEENGYGIQIDILVLNMACEQINAWRAKGFDLSVSVNISPKHFVNGLIYDTVSKALENKHIEPSMLKIELLESALLENFDTTIKVINKLREMGVAIALDDFGAGYSSLDYVAKLPLDYLKIDRGFSMNLNENPSNRIILETIMTLAKGMGVKTITEGVENQAQFDFLKKIGGDIAQGYFINRPMSVNEFELLFEQNKSRK